MKNYDKIRLIISEIEETERSIRVINEVLVNFEKDREYKLESKDHEINCWEVSTDCDVFYIKPEEFIEVGTLIINRGRKFIEEQKAKFNELAKL